MDAAGLLAAFFINLKIWQGAIILLRIFSFPRECSKMFNS